MASAPNNGDLAKAAIVLLEILKLHEQQIRDGKIDGPVKSHPILSC
jgi:hypothetical protein